MRDRLWVAVAAGCVWASAAWGQGGVAGESRFLAAREAAQRGDSARLEQLANSVPATPAVLDPYIVYWQWAVRVARTSESVPVTALRDHLRANEGSWLAERLRGDWLRRLGREGDFARFNEEYGALEQPDQELQCHAIRAGHPAGETALLALEAQWLSLTDTPESCVEPLARLVVSGRKTQEDVWLRLRRLVEANRQSAARQALALLGAEAPDAAVLARVFDAPDRFLVSPAARNAATRAGRELVLAAVARAARREPKETHAAWRALDEARYTNDERAYALAQLAWGAAQGQLDEAHAWFSAARRLAPGLSMGEEQRAWQVRAALREGDWASVQAAIEQMSSAQRALPDWHYWMARALAMQGRPQEARLLHERYAGEPHFYGILSAEALGRTLSWPMATTPPSAQELAEAEAMPGVQRAVALLRLDQRVDALREWNWALRRADDRRLLAASEYTRRQGFYDRAIQAADRTRQQHDFSLRYLAPFYDVFSREARGRGLELSWVYGLTRQESRFIVAARSPVGAQGLMQIMPATGRMVARQVGLSGFTVSQLGEIDTNVRLGTAYLRSVLDELSSSPVMATAAYNAGPGRARRWRAEQALEAAIYAETIPFTETRDYVKKVMANTVAYAVLLEGKPLSLTRFMGIIPGTRAQAAAPALTPVLPQAPAPATPAPASTPAR